MKVAIYSPYLDAFGGGERYMLTIAEGLSRISNVDLLLDNHLFKIGADKLKDGLGKRFDLDLSQVKTIKAPVGKGSNGLSRAFFLKNYDVLFYLTDGSIFYSTAKKSILHVQSPIVGQPANNIWRQFKLKSWNLIIYNSNFTKVNCQKYWPLQSEVIYPPVDVDKIKPTKKKKYILSVGRFFAYLKDKKQELLINTFKDLYRNDHLKDWSLHLVGSAGNGDLGYLEQLRSLATGLPIKFYPNLAYDELCRLYGESAIYWHAAGFGEEDPTKMEHFGISTVEAMSAAVVPAVIGKGGQVEIVEHGQSGFLWSSLDELKRYTIQLIKDEQLLKKLSIGAKKRALDFSKTRFEDRIKEIIK